MNRATANALAALNQYLPDAGLIACDDGSILAPVGNRRTLHITGETGEHVRIVEFADREALGGVSTDSPETARAFVLGVALLTLASTGGES